MTSSILLTGGTGFFGRAILNYFLKNAFQETWVHVLTRDPETFLARYPQYGKTGKIIFHKGDIQDPTSLPSNELFTHILHAATDSTVGTKLTPLQRYSQIVDGTQNILKLAVASGAKRFLLTSSGAVYGTQPPHLAALPEDWIGSPALDNTANAYGLGKRAAESLCVLYRDEYGLETIVARCFSFVGPDLPLNAHFAIGNFIRDALSADIITVAGDGTPLRTYLDQTDLAHWLFILLEHGQPGQAYNVGSDEVISIEDLAYLVRDILAPEKPVRILGQPILGATRDRYVPDIYKVQYELGLNITMSIAEAIRRAAAVHRTVLNRSKSSGGLL